MSGWPSAGSRYVAPSPRGRRLDGPSFTAFDGTEGERCDAGLWAGCGGVAVAVVAVPPLPPEEPPPPPPPPPSVRAFPVYGPLASAARPPSESVASPATPSTRCSTARRESGG